MTGHTPLPWIAQYYTPECGEDRSPRLDRIVGPDGKTLCVAKMMISMGSTESVANTELIIRAVNSHAGLLAAARRMLDMLTCEGDPNSLIIPSEIEKDDQVNEFIQAFADLELAVAKADGRPLSSDHQTK